MASFLIKTTKLLHGKLYLKRDALLKFNISINLYKKCFFAYELYIRYGNKNSTNEVLK